MSAAAISFSFSSAPDKGARVPAYSREIHSRFPIRTFPATSGTKMRGVVRAIANRALVMLEGEVCEEGSIEGLFSAARHPYTQELLAAIPEPIVSSAAAARA
jgi:hypothetical protein